jgi:hypothetical protein
LYYYLKFSVSKKQKPIQGPKATANMADEIAQLRQLQAGLNAAFDDLFKTTQEKPNDTGAIAAAKEQIGNMAQITFGTVLGPAFSIIGLTMQVSSRIHTKYL